jgi:hypothetical protein
MLSQAQRDLLGYGLVYLLVGGYGFLLFFYPEVALRVFRQTATPNKLKLAKTIGAIELALVLFGVLAYIVSRFNERSGFRSRFGACGRMGGL